MPKLVSNATQQQEPACHPSPTPLLALVQQRLAALLGPGFATHLLALGTRAKAMLESPTFERMANGNPDQLLVWLSDMANGSEAQVALSR